MEVAGPSGYDTIYNRCKTHERGSRKKKTSPKIWWIRKVVVPLHSQLKREGCPSELGDPTGQRCLTQFLERCTAGGFGGFLLQQLRSFSRGFSLLEGLSKKKLPRIFGGFKNLLYLCTHNPQEEADRSSRVKRSWSGAPNEGLRLREL